MELNAIQAAHARLDIIEKKLFGGEGNWVAECTLCKWNERHVEQDDALKAATKHAFKEHFDEQTTLQSGKWVTHVQQRAVDAFGAAPPQPPEVIAPEPVLPIAATVEEARELPAATVEGQ